MKTIARTAFVIGLIVLVAHAYPTATLKGSSDTSPQEGQTKVEPMHLRGPTPNGRWAKRSMLA